MNDIAMICKTCQQEFLVPLAVFNSRDVETCVACFRRSPNLLIHTGPMIDFKPDHIDFNIYLGGYRTAMKRKILQERNIVRVIVCGNDLKQHFNMPEPENNLPAIEYLQFPLEDEHDQLISPYFDVAHDFIDSSPGNVLVHCHAGVSRSATIVLSYLMKHKRMTEEEARLFAKAKRKCVCPNPGFLRQLQEYEQQLGIAGSVREVEVIENENNL